MWKATTGHNVVATTSNDDDWDTDPDFVNDVTEKEQRKGTKAIDGSTKAKDTIDIAQLRNQVVNKNEEVVKKEYQAKGTFAAGYGGKFGVQTDRMDKSAVGFDSMTEPKADHSSVPKYQKPTTISAPSGSIKNKFESLNSGADAEKAQKDKIDQERAARAEKEKAERDRVKKEQDAKAAAAKAESAKAEAEAKAKADAAAKAKAKADAEAAEAAAAAAAAQSDTDYAAAAEAEAAAAQAQAEAEAQAAAAAAAEAEAEAAAAAAQYEQQQYEEQQPYDEQPPAQETYEEQPAAPTGSGFSATALYEYEAGGDDELPFPEGAVITNIEVIDEGWWRGEYNGKYGLFPANYVQA